MNAQLRFFSFLVLAVICIGAPSGYADERSDAETEVNDAIAEANAANNEAKENAPVQPEKGVEDALDQAIRNNEATQANPDARVKEKQDAQKAEDDARTRADAAKENAPDKDQMERYRRALERRRNAKRRLRAAAARMRQFLSSMNRREVETIINRTRRPMTELDQPVTAPTPSVSQLRSADKVSIEIAGTGETIGTVAKLTVVNRTPDKLAMTIPPMVLESKSGNNQHYACPESQTVDLGPKQSKTVPLEGVCIVRNKPPVGKGVTGDLAINDPTSGGSRDPACKIPTDDAGKLISITSNIYNTADELLKDGSFKGIPYSDPKKKKDVVVQWCTWVDPGLSKITGVPPATKDDLKKVVYKQVEEKGPMTPETKKKVDEGINTIFEKVELTSKKAKDLEEKEGSFPENIELTTEKAKDV